MTRRMYVETSALVKIVMQEAESGVLEAYLLAAQATSAELVTSWLGECELSRYSVREQVPRTKIEDALSDFRLAALTEKTYQRAGRLPDQHLRSLDALHVAVALEIDCDEFVSYDARCLGAAAAVGMATVSPGYR